jgi:phosphomannomutase/phosphoglucomutase
VHHLGSDGGVMITGSHNPAPDNGFKIMLGKASFFGDSLQRLRQLVEAPQKPDVPGGSVHTQDIDDAYVARLVEGLAPARKGMRIVVDAGNGAAGPLGLRALKAAGYDPVALYCDMDGAFPNHHPDPTVPENLKELIARVKSEGAEVGVAWDGDGDRLGVVDATGEIVWGDRLLALFSRGILEKTPGAAVIADVKCSQSLFDDCRASRGKAGDVEDRPLADQDQDEGGARGRRRRDERPLLLRGSLFRLRRRHLRRAAPARDLSAEAAHRAAGAVDLPPSFHTPELRVDCPTN